jgi:TonB family protein
MNPHRLLAVACVALLSVTVGAQSLPQRPGTEDVEFLKGTFRPGGGVRPPSVVTEVKPNYTTEARRRKIQGDVELQIVVGIDGRVDRARVTKSLDSASGLDAAALEAATQWRFKPGTLDGVSVPVVVNLLLTFRLTSCSGSGCIDAPVQPQQTLQASTAPESDDFLRGVYLSTLSGISLPQVVKEIRPSYTEQALRAKIQGVVELQAVVDVDGHVDRVRVTKSLDSVLGLDAAAIEAAKGWHFKPGQLNGQPVPVAVILVLQFKIRQ